MVQAERTVLWRQALALVMGLALVCSAREAELEPAEMVASSESGWPQWRGPGRDGICSEKGLLQSWPQGGPKLLWSVPDIGLGFAAPIIVNGTLYIPGDVDGEVIIHAIDMEGRVKWTAKNGQAWTKSFRGARASCTYHRGRIYHLNGHGRIVCLHAQSGAEVWAVDVLQRFEGRKIEWGISENLLADGDQVFVTPGGRKGAMAALDAGTGRTVWVSEPLKFERTVAFGGTELEQPKQDIDAASYASPILFKWGGRRHLVGASARHLIGVDADTGRLLWTYAFPTRYEVLGITPVLYQDSVLMTGPDGKGARLLRLKNHDEVVSVDEVWSHTIDTCHGGLVRVGDLLVGSWYRSDKGWGVIDLRTGQTLQHYRELAMGSVLWADGRFYCLTQEGTMALVQADATQFRVVSTFPLTEGRKSDCWTHPVIFDGRLYLRYHGKLSCFDIKAR